MTIFFTSDQHFGHKNIIHLCDRPFSDTVQMNNFMTYKWNSVVTPDDVVYVLGDIAYKMARHFSSYMEPLNGEKHLIIGNHDKLPPIEYERHFKTVQTYLEIKLGSQRIVMFHYPMVSWNHRGMGSWHLYGHVHGVHLNVHKAVKAYNVGVDVNGFAPMSYDQIGEIMESRNVKISEDKEEKDK